MTDYVSLRNVQSRKSKKEQEDKDKSRVREMAKFTFNPTINENSWKIATKLRAELQENHQKTGVRLYEEGIKMKEKKEQRMNQIRESQYPFQPNTLEGVKQRKNEKRAFVKTFFLNSLPTK